MYEHPVQPYDYIPRFHSINIPNEWGLTSTELVRLLKKVSIQLISPTSGDIDWLTHNLDVVEAVLFPFN